MSEDRREGFVMYRSYVEAIRELPADQMKRIFLAIADYALDGIETEDEDPTVAMVMCLVKPQIDANTRRYKNGTKGGRPKKAEPEPVKQEPRQKPAKAGCEAILLNDGSEWQPDEDEYAEYVRLFPGVNIGDEFVKMRSWSIANGSKRKTRNGIKRFVHNWLSKEQDRATAKKGTTAGMVTIPVPDYGTNNTEPATAETLKKWEERMKKK
jgi:hypothetical protein